MATHLVEAPKNSRHQTTETISFFPVTAEQRPLFLQKHETELMEEGIEYLLDPVKINLRD
jgi:hypothetical protein